MHKICEMLDESKSKDELLSVIHSIVWDSIEINKVKRIDDFDDDIDDDFDHDVPKTEEEILDSISDNANDALVIMAEQLYQIINELCLIYFDGIKDTDDFKSKSEVPRYGNVDDRTETG